MCFILTVQKVFGGANLGFRFWQTFEHLIQELFNLKYCLWLLDSISKRECEFTSDLDILWRIQLLNKKNQKLFLDGHFKYSLFSLIKNLITFMSHIRYHVGRYKIRRRNCKFTQLWFIFYEVLQVYILLCTGVILLCTKVKIVLEEYPTVIWFPQREI